jgi:hypothetical protein
VSKVRLGMSVESSGSTTEEFKNLILGLLMGSDFCLNENYYDFLCVCVSGWSPPLPTIYIVTCQPFVGLRNGVWLGSRPLSTSRPSMRCAAVGEAGSSPRSRDDVTRQHARFRGNTV